MRAATMVLDRIDPSQGYVPGNVRWICNGCNLRRQ